MEPGNNRRGNEMGAPIQVKGASATAIKKAGPRSPIPSLTPTPSLIFRFRIFDRIIYSSGFCIWNGEKTAQQTYLSDITIRSNGRKVRDFLETEKKFLDISCNARYPFLW
jgi:hypothetical protein